MTTRWLGIVVATLCCLLTFATSASAECAWVLWTAVRPIAPNSPPLDWLPSEGFERKVDCVKAVKEQGGRVRGDAVQSPAHEPQMLFAESEDRCFASAAWARARWSALVGFVEPDGGGHRGMMARILSASFLRSSAGVAHSMWLYWRVSK